MNSTVDTFFSAAKKWKDEINALRKIVLETGLQETFKWRAPCYVFEESNIVIIGIFKDFCALSFFKGVLLKDPKGLLTKPGENSQSTRFLRFTNVEEVIKMESEIKKFIKEAIKNEKAGLKVDFKEKNDLVFPEELEKMFKSKPDFKKAFVSLTPGRQRAYILFFNQAKQSQTRTSRIENYMPRILMGKGFNDCVCGLSKKMPACDGSHKLLKKPS